MRRASLELRYLDALGRVLWRWIVQLGLCMGNVLVGMGQGREDWVGIWVHVEGWRGG